MEPRARILLVEDDVGHANATARWLRQDGYEVVVAHDGAQAEAAEGIFDCGVFDFDLLDTKGPDLAEHLLELVAVRRAVFFTSSYDAEMRKRADNFGPVVDKAEGVAMLLYVIAAFLHDAQAVSKAVGAPSDPTAGGIVPAPGSATRRRKLN